MKIHEYQAKQLLAQYGVPIPKGGVARTAKEVRKIAEEVGGPVAIKAQIYAGGRGKAGGIKVANTPVEAEEAAKSLLGKRLITHQTGPEGLPVNVVLVEEVATIKRELYVGILIDSAESMPLMIASAAGGVDIEEVAAKSPEKILQEHIDPVTGMRPYQARKLAYGLNLAPDQIQAAIQIMTGMYKLFMEKDSSLTEINPLVVTKDGGLLALDAKVNFDDNGVPYHEDIAELHDISQEDPLETEASKANVNYVKLDGNIGCMVNGAGLAMATMDFIKYQGGEPANFLDIGGGVTEEGIRDAFRILLSDTKVKVAWVNIFGGIVRCDLVARGIIQAVKAMKLKVPLVIRMHGTNLEEAMRLLKESGLNIILETDFTEAAKNAVAAAKA
jgi:succinyl-CoA synthetase, beta subunit